MINQELKQQQLIVFIYKKVAIFSKDVDQKLHWICIAAAKYSIGRVLLPNFAIFICFLNIFQHINFFTKNVIGFCSVIL